MIQTEEQHRPTSLAWDQQPVKSLSKLQILDEREFNPPLKLISPLFSCLSRPQYKRSCGISSLVSIWNFQFSRLGKGALQPLSVEQCLYQLGIVKHLKPSAQLADQTYKTNNVCVNNLDFGKFTGNTTLITWFRLLCKIHNVRGRAFVLYAPTFAKQAFCKSKEQARRQIILGLMQDKSFIYHCHDHYMVPVGFHLNPSFKEPLKENCENNLPSEETKCTQPPFTHDTVFLIGQPSKMFAPFHELTWDQMDHDMRTPYYNVRRAGRGVEEGKGVKAGNTNKCIVCFERIGIDRK